MTVRARPRSTLRWLALPGVGIQSFVREGVAAAIGRPRYAEVPAHAPSLRAIAEAALDRSFSRGMNLLTELPHPKVLRRARAEAAEMAAFMAESGFHEDPARYHRTPEPPDAVRRASARSYLARPARYEGLSFASGYEPHPGEPGGSRWLRHPTNHTVHAQLFEHRGDPRPWVVCVHGFGMGTPVPNFTVFAPERLHAERGWNVVMPSLPLHGRRGVGRFSGREVLAPDYLRIVHLLAQGVWDVRRLVAWIRARGGTRIALYGISLGAYVSALVAALEVDLAGAVAGIPAVDFPNLARDHEPRELRRYGADARIDWDHVRGATRAVSPLALAPRVPRERRFIFAGTADRVSGPDQARALWRHWDRCAIHWFAGGHVAAQWNPTIAPFVDASLGSILD
ncbi:MAG TPA: alpha/beta fold hydrolase [Myxococcota bacterium]|nr:alpha/beta fold hydrolase [Myxococcota bacterium]